MISLEKLSQWHLAAKYIEVDGAEGVQSATRVVGEEIALALLVAHLRRSLGSTDSYPARPGIEEETNAILKNLDLW